MNVKRIISVFMCFAMLLTALPLSVFAENEEPYAKIRFRNPEKYNVAFGETEEVYLDYNTYGIEIHKIEWEVSKKLPCKIEYVTDESTGLVTGAKLTGKNFGSLTLTARLLDENGNEIISDKRSLYVVESENKNAEEKFKIFLKNSYLVSAMGTMYIVIPLVGAVVFSPVLVPYYVYLTVKAIILGV